MPLYRNLCKVFKVFIIIWFDNIYNDPVYRYKIALLSGEIYIQPSSSQSLAGLYANFRLLNRACSNLSLTFKLNIYKLKVRVKVWLIIQNVNFEWSTIYITIQFTDIRLPYCLGRYVFSLLPRRPWLIVRQLPIVELGLQ